MVNFSFPQFTNVHCKLERLSLASRSSIVRERLEPTRVKHLSRGINHKLSWKGLGQTLQLITNIQFYNNAYGLHTGQ